MVYANAEDAQTRAAAATVAKRIVKSEGMKMKVGGRVREYKAAGKPRPDQISR